VDPVAVDNRSVIVFPLGHPVELVSRSTAALDAAERCWPGARRLFDVEPLRFIVDLKPPRDAPSAVKFMPDAEGFAVDAGPAGVGRFLVATRSGTLCANASALVPLLEVLVLTALGWTFFIGVHAACVVRQGRSVLLFGDSQAGKSTLSYACSRAGWTFVSDNAMHWAAAPWDTFVSGSATIRLRDGARKLFGLEASEIAPGEQGMLSAPTAPPGPCVFLRRRAGPAILTPAPAEEAMTYLAQYDTRPDRAYAEERYRALLTSGVWVMQYEDTADAMRCLETLL
jgi:hypothetical protein